MREKVLRQERAARHFLEVLIHDVRARQRGVNTSAELLANELQGQLNGTVQEILNHIHGEVTRMNLLMAAVSGYADTMPGARYAMTTIPLEIPLQSALSEVGAMVRESGTTVNAGVLPKVYGDPGRLASLFRHLITNAILYRGNAPPRIEIRTEPDAGRCLVSVRDNGIGIGGEYTDRLFVPFFRLHGADIPGTGLGLATCKNIVEAHGGKIWIASKICEGTTFFFTLALATEED